MNELEKGKYRAEGAKEVVDFIHEQDRNYFNKTGLAYQTPEAADGQVFNVGISLFVETSWQEWKDFRQKIGLLPK